MRRKTTALVVGAAALTVALSACGGGGGAGQTAGHAGPANGSLFSNSLDLVSAAKAETAESKSSSFSMETTMLGQSVKATGQGRYDGADTAMSMKMDLAGQAMEMVFVDSTMYLKLPTSVNAGKPWVKISADGTDEMSKTLAPMIKSVQDNDPSKTLDKISKAGTITKSEQVQLDGAPASHYVIDLDFSKLLDQFPGGLPESAMSGLRGKDLHTPAELWLNSDQLPVQMTMNMTKLMSASGLATQGESTTTMKYTDWGAPVNIEAPPQDQVGAFGQ